MSKKREDLINRIIAIHGHESPITIQFVKMCEEYDETRWNNAVLNLFVEAEEFSAMTKSAE